MLFRSLAIAGYDVRVASDGEEGIHKALSEKPDLVLLDLVLPKMDGFQVLSELRKNPRTQLIPIIILTNRDREDEIKKGLRLGATDYIVKIFATPTQVIDKIQKQLSGAITKPHRSGIASLGQYRLVIQPFKYDAAHLAHDFGLSDEYHCSECKGQIFLEISYDHTFSGLGNRFSGHFICPRCQRIY